MRMFLSVCLFIILGGVLAGCDSGDGDGGGFIPTGDILAVAERGGQAQTIKVGGTAGSVPPGSTVTVTNLDTQQMKTTTGLPDGSFDPEFTGSTNDIFNVLVTDNGNTVRDENIGVTLLRNAVERNLAKLGSVPAEIIIRGDRAYVINGFSNNIQVFDLNMSPPQQTGVIVVPMGSNPIAMDFLNNSIAYVANNIGQSIAVVNVDTFNCEALIVGKDDLGETAPCDEVIELTGSPFEEPAGVLVANGKVYISNNNLNEFFSPIANGFINVIDPLTNQIIDTIDATGANTTSMLVMDGSIFALNNGNVLFDLETFLFTCDFEFPPSIDEIDPQTDTIVDNIDIGLSEENPLVCLPNNLTATVDGFAYTGLGLVGALLKVDLLTGEVINGPGNPIIITDLSGLNNTADIAIKNDLLFTSLFNSDQIAVLDTNTDQVNPFPYITPFPAGIRGDDPNASIFDGVQSLAIRPGADFTGADIFFITGISEQLGSVDSTLETQ